MSSGKTSIVESPVPLLSENSLRISSRVSLISSGTERMLVGFGKASYIDKARQQPEKVKMVLDKLVTDGISTTVNAVRSKLAQPIPLGYSNVGVVQEVSSEIKSFKVGDRVVSNGAHADVVVVKKNLCARIPDEVDDDSAAFTVVASIGLQGVRLAEPTLGESFVVIGAGLIGLITIQLLIANGCKVLAIDFDEEKLKLARQFGAETVNPDLDENPLSVANLFSKGRGVDGVIITASSKSNDPVKNAARMCRKRGRIILVGVVGLSIDRADFYEKELSFQVSCSYGPGRYDSNYEVEGNDYPIGFVRWTEQRNFEAVLDLMASKALNIKPLISNRFDFINAADAYAELTKNSSALGILLDYNSSPSEREISSVKLDYHRKVSTIQPTFGIIGAGNYASRVLIPAFVKTNVNLHTLATANGINSIVHGKNFGFAEASSDTSSIFKNKEINTVVIITQHDSHAGFVIEGLNADKNVWVEKPLAIDLASLDAIESAYYNALDRGVLKSNSPQLMVGFNRRFSPQIKKMKQLLSNEVEPKTFILTINAGFISQEHWTQDMKLGGGRIIGEACHFIDLLRFLVGRKIISMQARAMESEASGKVVQDTATITLGFADGSFGTIIYLANGSSSFPKERIEVFVGQKTLQLDNFRKLKGFGWPGFSKMNLYSQNKGQDACAKAFVDGLGSGVPCIPAEEIFEVARISIEASNIISHQ